MEDQNAKELHEPGFLPPDRNDPMFEAEDEGEELTATDRILYVVTSPRRAFQGLHRVRLGSVIGISMVVTVVLMIISTAMMFSSENFVDTIRESQVEALEKARDRPGISQADEEAIDRKIADVENTSPTTYMILGSIFPALGMLLVLCIIGLIVFMIAKILESGRETRVTYGQSLAVASLSSIVTSVVGLVMGLIVLATGNAELARGLGTLVETDSAVLQGLIGSLSPGYLWWYIVTGIGIAALSRSSVAKSTFFFAGVVIVCLIILGVIGSALGGMF